jgi:hypothetical protein
VSLNGTAVEYGGSNSDPLPPFHPTNPAFSPGRGASYCPTDVTSLSTPVLAPLAALNDLR